MLQKYIAEIATKLYIKHMLSYKLKVLVLLSLVLLIMPGCSKKTITEPENLISGRIMFTNTSSYSIILNYMIQSRGVQRETRNLGYRVEGHSGPAGRVELSNLIDGGYIFPGGDNVFVEFQSVAVAPDNPDEPLFRRTVTMTVDGTQNVEVKGQSGEYVIGGD
jgi:hypothetical protein